MIYKHDSFFSQVRSIDITYIARRLGLNISKNGRSAGPCPVCHHSIRSHKRKDRRLPLGFRADCRGWECQHCHTKGDGIDLTAYCINGTRYRELTSSQKLDIHEWYTCEGLVDETSHTTTKQRKSNKTTQHKTPKVNLPHHISNTPKAPLRPPLQEIMTVWENSIGVLEDKQAMALLKSWNASPEMVYLHDLARILPSNGPHFPWMTARKKPWHTGWRLLVPAFGANGKIESLKARWMHDKTPPCNLKSASPRGYQIGQLVTANTPAEIILKTGQLPQSHQDSQEQQHLDIWITEGEKDLISWATQQNQHPSALHAVFGTWAGGWTAEFAARLPLNEQIRIIIATDYDKAGHQYAKHVYKTLITRGFKREQIMRWRG